MKAILALIASLQFSGCFSINAGLEYTDPKSGATAHIGISRDVKPKFRNDSKRVVPLERH